MALDAAAARRVEDPPVAGRGDEDASARGPGRRPSPSPGPPRRGPRAAAWRRGAGPARRAGGGRPTCARPGRRAASPAPGPAAGAAAPGRSPRRTGAPRGEHDPGAQRPRQPLRQDVAGRARRARAPRRWRAGGRGAPRGRPGTPVVHEERRQDAVGGVGALAVGERVRRGGPRRGAARALGGQPRPGRRQQRPGLDEALLELGLGVRVATSRRRPRRARRGRRASSKVRMATLSSSPATRAGEADRAGVGLAPGRLELGDDAQRLDLGRAGHRAGREGRAQQLGVGGVRAQGARAPRRRGARRRRGPAARRSASTCTEPYAQTRPRSLRMRSTIITFSARSLADAAQRRAGVAVLQRRGALDRRGPHGAPAALAGRARARGETAAPTAPVTSAARSGRRAPAARAKSAAGEPCQAASRRRQRLAWKSSPAAIRSRQAATAARCPAAPGAAQRERAQARRRAARRRPRAASRPRSASRRAASAAVAGGRPQRLEPPAPVRVQAQDVVVEGEVGVGERRRARGRRGHALQAPRQAEAEPADPAAADGVARGLAALDRGLVVEQGERVVVRRGRPAPAPSRGSRRRRPSAPSARRAARRRRARAPRARGRRRPRRSAVRRSRARAHQ